MTATSQSSATPDGAAPASTKRLGRFLTTGLLVLFFVAGLAFLFVREVMVPRVEQFRPQIAAAIGHAIGLPVSIEALSADLSGLRPRLHLGGLLIRDLGGRPALRLDAVDATLAWSSILRGKAYFHRLVVHAPELALRRELDGQVFVAGVRIDPNASGDGFSDWLLGQREIVVRNAAVSWSDAMRGAPDLRLERVDFRLSHRGGRYRFGLRAHPPETLASALDVRGDLISARPADPAAWTGQLYLSLDQADLGGWRAWVDYPVALAGAGGVRAWIGVGDGQIGSLTANVLLDDVVARLDDTLPELQLTRLSGRISGSRSAGALEVSARNLELLTRDGVRVEPTDFDLALRGPPGDEGSEGAFSANRLDFAALARLAAHLPFEASVRERLAAFDPRGRLESLRLDWSGAVGLPRAWTLQARFADIGLHPQGALPGVSGLSGEIDGTERAGRFRLAGQDATLELPAVFRESRMMFSMLRADGGWARRDGRLEIALDNAAFENPDAAGSASGRYYPVEGGRGEIDLSARLTRADGQAVWRYLPLVVNDSTRDWLRDSLTGGVVPDARLRLRGDLADFPYRDGTSGQFLVTTRISGASLTYAEGWPPITGIDGELRFEGPAMRISADRAQIFGVALSRVVAEVPELNAPAGEEMTIRGRASGPTTDFLRFVSESPVAGRIDGFTDAMRAEGSGNLDLTLVMPLRHIADTTVKGEFRFAANRLWIVDGLPALDDAGGRVRFTANDFAIPEARARVFGEPMTLSARSGKDGGVSFAAAGAATLRDVRQTYAWPFLAHLSGTAPWQADIEVRREGTQVAVRTDLLGIASSLPEPANKSATARWPLEVKADFAAGGGREQIRARLADRAELELVRRRAGEGWEIERGGLAVFAPLRVSDRGLMVVAKLDELDVDAWRQVFGAADEPASDRVPAERPVALAGVSLQAGQVLAFGQTLSAVQLDAEANRGGWTGRVASAELEGEFDWRDLEEGTLRARLKHLVVGRADEAADDSSDDNAEVQEPPRRLPGLDIVADRFVLRGIELGRLELQARNRGGLWHLDSLALANPDGKLSGTGQWRPGGAPLTELDFRLETSDIGRLASRLGYGDAVRAGNATLAGKVGWRGGPSRIHYPSLSGTMTVEADKGQFRKLDPGVGRLLGVLSLQALPRRLTLDFRDVFSEGFAFDLISGSIDASAGVMHTDDLQIRGPAARIRMSGSADLEAETQDLRVTVQPTLSESIAIGAAAGLINPVAGIVTYFAQKALSDPIEKLFAFRYAVTGSWADPRVEELSRGAAAPGAQPDKQQ